MNRPDPTGFAAARRQRWMQQVAQRVGSCPGDADFDAKAIRHLLGELDARGFPHLAHAVLRSGLDVAARRSGPEEFDALVDLAIDLVAQGRRDTPATLLGNGCDGDPEAARDRPDPARKSGLTLV